MTIKVTFNRQRRFYPTEHSLTPDEFVKVQGSKPRGKSKVIALSLQAYEYRAAEIIEKLIFFTFEAFEKRYFLNIGATDTLSCAFDIQIQDFNNTGQIGSAIVYKNAQASLDKFQKEAKFLDVTPRFLEKYETWMEDQGRSKATVGMYLRSLRCVFNNAISDGILNKEHYPFGKRKYQIPTGKNVKKALALHEVGLIYHYDAIPGGPEAKAKNYWLFLYLCNGMNVKDMALLKYKNLKGDVLEFVRAKTERTKREVEPIRVMLSAEAIDIIDKFGTNSMDPEAFIFPILSKGLSPIRERELIDHAVHVINNHMKAIALKVGIQKPVTTYVARHSFATVMQRSGASIELIGESLGHGSTKTTQSYLAGFEDEHKREMAKALIAFK